MSQTASSSAPARPSATFTLKAVITPIFTCASRHDSTRAAAAGFTSAVRLAPGCPRMIRSGPAVTKPQSTMSRVLHNNTGWLVPGMGKNVYVTALTSVPFGEWFTLEAIADGNTFALLVNGKSSGYHVPGNPNLGVSRGHIALQQYSPESVIEFRRIQLNRRTRKISKEIGCLRGHSGRVNRVTFLPDGLRILSGGFNLEHVIENGSNWVRGGFDNTVQLWEVASGRHLLTLTEDASGGVGVLAISSESRYVASSDELRRFVWDLTTGRRINRFPENKSLANGVGTKPQLLFLGTTDESWPLPQTAVWSFGTWAQKGNYPQLPSRPDLSRGVNSRVQLSVPIESISSPAVELGWLSSGTCRTVRNCRPLLVTREGFAEWLARRMVGSSCPPGGTTRLAYGTPPPGKRSSN